MAKDAIERLLEAEKAAQLLVDELQRLKKESDAYVSARATLDQAGAAVAHLAGQLRETTTRLHQLVTNLESTGIAEIVDVRRAIMQEVASLREEVHATAKEVLTELNVQGERLLGQVNNAKSGAGRALMVAYCGWAVTLVALVALLVRTWIGF